MIGLDTNVLARYIAQDDPKQSLKANRLMDSLTADEPGFISTVALVELSWVLTSCYEFDKRQWAHTLDLLLHSRDIAFENKEVVGRALRRFQEGNADFADCMIERSGDAAGCSHTFTFDVGAARRAGMSLIE
jgi:predicted nucleic-acid-binding protein